MIRVDAGCRVDLQAVVAVAGILKQAVHWVQYIMRHMEKPFPAKEKACN